MKTFLLALSAALLVVASGFPRTHEGPIGALLLIPKDKILLPQPIPLLLLTPEAVDDETLQDGDHEIMEELWNEPPSELDASANLPPSIRSRRSTQPGAPSPQGGQSGDRGGVEVGVSRGEGGSRRVEARGEGNVWQSNDGRGRVDVHGHYSRDYGGRYGTQRPNYGGGIRYSHRF
ncbi:uncharacterized protein LOC124154126 isoform X2 [Ischnura elegans]|uniref:uncharacterized protein LOC124154126 isoform X2 n=1 Tax=Ischnura elegans TaxID=197161 RepID=UPI001ED87984|nr:uncharacterized protein LOC124154126 isoform X2 [Ischnura elegans]XP_046383615.1 uncharacterized protein LOC124154126 isoform X2 [Ischnura elegans]